MLGVLLLVHLPRGFGEYLLQLQGVRLRDHLLKVLMILGIRVIEIDLPAGKSLEIFTAKHRPNLIKQSHDTASSIERTRRMLSHCRPIPADLTRVPPCR